MNEIEKLMAEKATVERRFKRTMIILCILLVVTIAVVVYLIAQLPAASPAKAAQF